MQEDLQPSQATAELPPQPSQATTVPPPKSQEPSVEPPSGSSEAAVQPPPMSTQAAVSGGGLQGSALESATSSNARHHSTATKASGGPDSPAQVSGKREEQFTSLSKVSMPANSLSNNSFTT